VLLALVQSVLLITVLLAELHHLVLGPMPLAVRLELVEMAVLEVVVG
jgi:hypothetical protein